MRPVHLEPIEEHIIEHMAGERVPGLALGIVQGDRLTYARGFGVTTIAPGGEPVTPDTAFRIASVSKPITATAIMRLVELGELELDRAVCTYGVEAPDAVTLRMLLTHTSGLPTEDDAVARRDNGRRMVLAPPPPPLERPIYSNLGFTAAGYVAESVTGQPFPELVERLVLEPLGMTRTTFDPAAVPKPFAEPHVLEDGILTTLADAGDPVAYAPARGGFSTIRDLSHFALAHIHAGMLLSGESLDEMHRLHIRHTPTKDAGFGLGVEIFSYKGTRGVGHNGDLGAYKSWLVIVPEERVAVIMLCNRPPMFRLMPVPWRVLDTLLGLPDYPWRPFGSRGQDPSWLAASAQRPSGRRPRGIATSSREQEARSPRGMERGGRPAG